LLKYLQLTVTDILLTPQYTQLSKYAMTAAHEVSVAREPIGVAEMDKDIET